MKFNQKTDFYKVKELFNLMNDFEKIFPIIKNKIHKYNLKNLQEKCYIAWNAGIFFYLEDEPLNEIQKKDLDYWFKNFEKYLDIGEVEEKPLLFIYFSLGGISVLNYPNILKSFKDFFPTLAKGIVIFEKEKFDYFKDGYKAWRYETIMKYFQPKNFLENFKNIKKNKNISSEDKNTIIN